MTQTASADLTTVLRGLRETLDRSDIPSEMKISLGRSITTLMNAYTEDDDPKSPPNARSFEKLLQFLSQPHHQLWVTPGISAKRDGTFQALWEHNGTHRWILEFPPEGDVEHFYLNLDPTGKVSHQRGSFGHSNASVMPPFPIPNR